ncbi:MAG TPA: maltose phosphorylase, partial [Erysipelotrichaceae bacterium]|nr:maltose phosphorylase [Erysipelotrichaceae bacterium]
DYHPQDVLANDPELRKLVDFIVSDEMKAIGDQECLYRLYNDMTNKDWFMALLDARDYIQTKEQAIADFNDRKAWAKKMLINISKAGFFSSDRTIAQYNEDIWKLK